MTTLERMEAEQLLRKYDAKTLAPLAVSCGMVRILKEHEEQQKCLKHRNQLEFEWDVKND